MAPIGKFGGGLVGVLVLVALVAARPKNELPAPIRTPAVVQEQPKPVALDHVDPKSELPASYAPDLDGQLDRIEAELEKAVKTITPSDSVQSWQKVMGIDDNEPDP